MRGDPSKATAEKGEKALEAAAEEVAAIVEELRARAIRLPETFHDVPVETIQRRLAGG